MSEDQKQQFRLDIDKVEDRQRIEQARGKFADFETELYREGLIQDQDQAMEELDKRFPDSELTAAEKNEKLRLFTDIERYADIKEENRQKTIAKQTEFNFETQLTSQPLGQGRFDNITTREFRNDLYDLQANEGVIDRSSIRYLTNLHAQRQAQMTSNDLLINRAFQDDLDPNNKDDRDAVDLFYQNFLSQNPDLPIETKAKATARIIKRKNIIPSQVERNLSRANLSEDADTIQEQVLMLNAIEQEANPEFQNQIDNNDYARLFAVKNQVENGIPVAQAIENVKEQQSKNIADRIEEFKMVQPTDFDEQAMNALIANRTFSQFFGTADPREDMVTDTRQLARTLYLTNPSFNFEDAVKRAGQIVFKNYGVTSIGDENRFMKFPPEKVLNKPTNQIDLVTRNLLREQGRNAEGRLRLQSDIVTEGSEPRSWLIQRWNEDLGSWDTIKDDNGFPFRASFDSNDFREQKLDEARELRDSAFTIIEGRNELLGAIGSPGF